MKKEYHIGFGRREYNKVLSGAIDFSDPVKEFITYNDNLSNGKLFDFKTLDGLGAREESIRQFYTEVHTEDSVDEEYYLHATNEAIAFRNKLKEISDDDTVYLWLGNESNEYLLKLALYDFFKDSSVKIYEIDWSQIEFSNDNGKKIKAPYLAIYFQDEIGDLLNKFELISTETIEKKSAEWREILNRNSFIKILTKDLTIEEGDESILDDALKARCGSDYQKSALIVGYTLMDLWDKEIFGIGDSFLFERLAQLARIGILEMVHQHSDHKIIFHVRLASEDKINLTSSTDNTLNDVYIADKMKGKHYYVVYEDNSGSLLLKSKCVDFSSENNKLIVLKDNLTVGRLFDLKNLNGMDDRLKWFDSYYQDIECQLDRALNARTIGEQLKHITSSDSVCIWLGEYGDEYIWKTAILDYLSDTDCAIYTLEWPLLPFNNFEDVKLNISSLYQSSTEYARIAGQHFKLITSEDRISLVESWQVLLKNNSDLRLGINNSIIEADVTYFDSLLLERCKNEFQINSRIVGDLYMDFMRSNDVIGVNDLFLYRRIEELIRLGKLVRGNFKKSAHGYDFFEVKLSSKEVA